jgi:redox-sensitive bicupin YhaK (pirin superfamily)
LNLYASVLKAGERVTFQPQAQRSIWVQVARGGIALNGQKLAEGDGAAISDEAALELSAAGPDDAELLLFDLA